MTERKKIAFFGTPTFTVGFLDALVESGFSPTLIITNPDRRAGRGMELISPEPKHWGEAHGVRLLQPDVIDAQFLTTLAQESWDLFIVVAYGKILPEQLITMPRFATINVHYSLLPKYRGATPVEAAILHGDAMTGVCIQQMRFKLDTGPVLAKKEVSIEATDTTETLRGKLNKEAFKLLAKTISSLFDGSATPIEQDDRSATHCGKISKTDGEISLSDDPVTLDRKFRAYTPWPGLYFYTIRGGRNIRVKITAAHFENGRFAIDTVIPESGKPMTWQAFQNWHTF